MMTTSIVTDLIKAIKPIFVFFVVFIINGIAYSAGLRVEDSAFFRADEECDLYSNIKTKENIDSVQTILGKEYRINLDDDSNKEYLNVIVDGAYPDNRWVKKYCGRIRTTHNFDPFFVARNPKDGQALFPTVTEFDQRSLDKCGHWGKRIATEDLNNLFSGKQLEYLYENLDHRVGTDDVDIETFKKELVTIWESAFEHVICGQPGHNKENILGGLHYVGRYLDLQKNNWGGLKSCKEFPIVKFPVYTIGVDFLNPSGRISTKCPISYNYNISVIDFIIEGTKAFKESNGSSGVCTYSNNGVDYTFVSRNKKIVTLYPNIRSTAPSCRISN